VRLRAAADSDRAVTEVTLRVTGDRSACASTQRWHADCYLQGMDAFSPVT
jgi:hypothetical protein